MHVEESQQNSQTETGTDEPRLQEHQSQTPPLRSMGGSDGEDTKEEDREEHTSGTVWGHARFPRSVYGNNPGEGDKTQSKPNVVWDVVKHLKEKTGLLSDLYRWMVYNVSTPSEYRLTRISVCSLSRTRRSLRTRARCQWALSLRPRM